MDCMESYACLVHKLNDTIIDVNTLNTGIDRSRATSFPM